MRPNLLHTAAAAAILSAFLASTGPSRAGEGPKELAYQVVDRNADPMAKIGDSIYYFGELGMQEFESTKLLQDTLEAAGFYGRARRRRHADQCLGQMGQRQAGDRDRHRDRCAAGRLADARRIRAQAAGRGRARPHGRAQHPWRRCHRGRLRGQGDDDALQHPGQRRGLVRARRGATHQPALPRARRLFQGCRRGHHPAHRRQFLDRLRPAELRRDQRELHLPRQDRARRRQSVGRQGRARRRRADGHRRRLSARAAASDLSAHRAITNGGIQPNVIPDSPQIWWWVRDANMPDAMRPSTSWSTSPRAPR